MRPETCDRCGRILGLEGWRAVHKDGRDLFLCDGHRTEHDAALTKQGWAIDRLNPPDPVAGPKTFTQCGCCGSRAGARYVTASPESVQVKIVNCVECDSRTCNNKTPMFGTCESKALNATEKRCPKGHPLMGEPT
jgi:hypothetical protein